MSHSTRETEYITLSDVCREVIYLGKLESEFTGGICKLSLFNSVLKLIKKFNLKIKNNKNKDKIILSAKLL